MEGGRECSLFAGPSLFYICVVPDTHACNLLSSPSFISRATVLQPSHFNLAAAAPDSTFLHPIPWTFFITLPIHTHPAQEDHYLEDCHQHSRLEHRLNISIQIKSKISSCFSNYCKPFQMLRYRKLIFPSTFGSAHFSVFLWKYGLDK